VATSRITRERPLQSTWYWVKSPWNTRRRTVAGHTFRAPAGRARESRTWTVRIESSASVPTRRTKAVPWTMSPAAVSRTTRPSLEVGPVAAPDQIGGAHEVGDEGVA